MKKLFLSASMIALIVSCVNSDYDLSKVDMEMTFFNEEGIEIPIPGDVNSEIKLLEGNDIKSVVTEVATSTVKDLSLNNVSDEKMESGIEVKGKFLFNLDDVPELYKSPDCSIKFKDDSFFSLNIDNDCTGNLLISCDILDAKGGKVIGKADNVPVNRGNGQAVKLLFNKCGMSYLPDVAEISNIVIKKNTTKAEPTVSGTLYFKGASLNLSSVILAGSELNVSYDFSDVFEELEIDISILGDRVSSKSFTLNGTVVSDLPVKLNVTVSGDISAKFSFESPTGSEGKKVSIESTCTKDISSAKQVKLVVSLLSTGEIDLSKLDSYRLSASLESIRFNEGITVTL